MIKITNISKKFDTVQALSNVSFTIANSAVFGLIGTNGAGKSTLLRIMAGILKQDEGTVEIDGSPVFEKPSAKQNFFFIPDEAYFFSGATPKSIAAYYAAVYPQFNMERFLALTNKFNLNPKRKISTFSKGMKRQVSILAAICSGTKYIFCDETFDGLDPVMRQAVKSLFASDMESRGLTPIIASHNLRELEDICDNIAYLHEGGVLLSDSLTDLKLNICKIQIVPSESGSIDTAFSGFKIYSHTARGSLNTLILNSTADAAETAAKAISPVFYEILPLSLEEIFISEAESAGYSVKEIIL